jgi:hypothetical protein
MLKRQLEVPPERAERRRRLAEPPLAFPAHGHSTRQWRQALYEFEKEPMAPRRGRLAPVRSRDLPAIPAPSPPAR